MDLFCVCAQNVCTLTNKMTTLVDIMLTRWKEKPTYTQKINKNTNILLKLYKHGKNNEKAKQIPGYLQ